MRIRWTIPAVDDLERIADYIAQDNTAAARAVTRAIVDGVSELRDFPNRGRPGESPDTRELVISAHTAYVVVYHVGKEAIEIWHVWHGAQDWHQ
jgi:addiction module RelE/StbE family toxin